MSPPRSDGSRRILLAGGAEMDRRLRMSMKVTQELRRRGSTCTVVSCGNVPEEFHRVAPPDEVHTELSEPEVLNLFSTASVLLEATDEQPSAAADVAAAIGLPVVCHAGARCGASSHVIAEWSADAFADILMQGVWKVGVADEVAAGAALRRLTTILV